MTFAQEPHTRENHPRKGWIGVDLDRTMASYESWSKNGPTLGVPIPAMVERVRRWIAGGEDVRVFTARASSLNPRRGEDTVAIQEWCRTHLGMVLAVTNEKDFHCKEIWDDIAVSVEPNTGWRLSVNKGSEPLSYEEEMRLTGFAIDSFSPRPHDKTADDIFVIPEGAMPDKVENGRKWSKMAAMADARGKAKDE